MCNLTNVLIYGLSSSTVAVGFCKKKRRRTSRFSRFLSPGASQRDENQDQNWFSRNSTRFAVNQWTSWPILSELCLLILFYKELNQQKIRLWSSFHGTDWRAPTAIWWNQNCIRLCSRPSTKVHWDLPTFPEFQFCRSPIHKIKIISRITGNAATAEPLGCMPPVCGLIWFPALALPGKSDNSASVIRKIALDFDFSFVWASSVSFQTPRFAFFTSLTTPSIERCRYLVVKLAWNRLRCLKWTTNDETEKPVYFFPFFVHSLIWKQKKIERAATSACVIGHDEINLRISKIKIDQHTSTTSEQVEGRNNSRLMS